MIFFRLNVLLIIPSLLVARGCYNKLPKTEWLKTTNLFSHNWEARSSKSVYRQARFTLEALRESFLASSSFRWLLAFLDFPGLCLYHSNLCFHLHYLLLCGCLLFCLLQGHLVLNSGPTQVIQDDFIKILNFFFFLRSLI